MFLVSCASQKAIPWFGWLSISKYFLFKGNYGKPAGERTRRAYQDLADIPAGFRGLSQTHLLRLG
jgi:hypothetical protein